ncbi:MAG: YgiQ family radical SAM protein [bacterium]
MFLPCTAEEMKRLGWDAPDIILVSGDTYLDTPFSGVALIGRILSNAGFRTAVIAQPSIATTDDIKRLGEPRLFWGVSGGCVDSMVANFTAMGKRRRQDDFTPGGENNARPDRAVIAYCNLIRSAFKPCKPLVIGGIEASLRRIAHYDFWTDAVRRPLLFDAKADVLVYGMADRTIVELAKRFRDNKDWHDLPGICYAAPTASIKLADAISLPSFSDVSAKDESGHKLFMSMFRQFSANQDAHTAKPLIQPVDTRAIVHNPPAMPLSQSELDAVYNLPFELDTHPFYAAKGPVRAWDTIRFSITTHRGCYGECNFCAIAAHQGRTVVSRSERSIVAEATRFFKHPKFKGIITDVGGPTANMYGFECEKKLSAGACAVTASICANACHKAAIRHPSFSKSLCHQFADVF